MAPRTSLALFLSLNLFFFTYTSATRSKSYTNDPGHPKPGTCPRDALKLGVCANVLKLVDLTLGSPPVEPCCSLIQGLADLEAAVCLCIALKANILGINLNLPINLSVLLNVCSRKAPKDFQCGDDFLSQGIQVSLISKSKRQELKPKKSSVSHIRMDTKSQGQSLS